MSEANGKSKKPIWVNFTILAFLLVTGGATLTACQKSAPDGDSTKQEVKKNQSAESDKTQETGQDKLGGKSLKQKKGQTAQADQRPNEETTNDDDPE